jgi:hypothetical protein
MVIDMLTFIQRGSFIGRNVKMSLSFLFMEPVFANKNLLEFFVRCFFVAGCVLTILALAFISVGFGPGQQDRFEVVSLSIAWLVLIINGLLLSIVFNRQIGYAHGAAS